MTPKRIVCPMLLAGLLGIIGIGTAEAKLLRYELDPVHSRIVFSCGHDGFSHSMGSFSRPTGELWFDPDDWRTARLQVWIDLNTLDMGDAGFTERVARSDYLSVTSHPQAYFVSEHIEPVDDASARVHGTLMLRGVRAPATLEVTLNRLARNALTLRQTAGFSATATLSRAAFGMTAHPQAVSDAVHLRIEAEAVRARQTTP